MQKSFCSSSLAGSVQDRSGVSSRQTQSVCTSVVILCGMTWLLERRKGGGKLLGGKSLVCISVIAGSTVRAGMEEGMKCEQVKGELWGFFLLAGSRL